MTLYDHPSTPSFHVGLLCVMGRSDDQTLSKNYQTRQVHAFVCDILVMDHDYDMENIHHIHSLLISQIIY